MRKNCYICIMDVASILEYLEKHLSWRIIVTAALLVAAYFVGYYYCSAKRDKQEAMLINQHTKDIKSYCDSATFFKIQNQAIVIKCDYLIRDKQKTIDSLNSIIKSYEDEANK